MAYYNALTKTLKSYGKKWMEKYFPNQCWRRTNALNKAEFCTSNYRNYVSNAEQEVHPPSHASSQLKYEIFLQWAIHLMSKSCKCFTLLLLKPPAPFTFQGHYESTSINSHFGNTPGCYFLTTQEHLSGWSGKDKKIQNQLTRLNCNNVIYQFSITVCGHFMHLKLIQKLRICSYLELVPPLNK